MLENPSAETGRFAVPSEPSTLMAGARALLLGPLWAAQRGRWFLFAATAIAEVTGITLLVQGFMPPIEDAVPMPGRGILILILARLAMAPVALYGSTSERIPDIRLSPRQSLWIGAAILLFAYPLIVYRFTAPMPWGALVSFPTFDGLDSGTAQLFDVAVDWMKRSWVDFFDAFTAGLRATLNAIETAFVLTPWPVVAMTAMLAAWYLSGLRAVVFVGLSLLYLGLFNFWEKSMSTMALVATSVIICVVIGIPIGILCAKNRRANTLIEPLLDIMQTLPTFVYLIPAVAFFSIGKPPGVIATVIFALPSMVRLTTLGIQQVPTHVREAADAFGATPVQLLLKVELPLAIPSIRLGINQTIMMSLSMVVVAAMIGAGGLGLEVIHSLQHLKTGQGILAGIAIVVCAMALDRMVRREGRARRRK
jgi:glycine betaine/proline transport system permease protein